MSPGRIFSLESDPWLVDHRLDGTPTVPLAVVAAELLHRAGPGQALCAFHLHIPLMLRKNRPLPLAWRAEETRLALAPDDGDEWVCARVVAASPFEGPSPRELRDRTLLFVREELYPTLFFHGPAFQADFDLETLDEAHLSARISEFVPAALSATWSGWPARPPEGRLDPVSLDLGIQLAALQAMHRRGRGVLPVAFDRLDVAAAAPVADRLRIRVMDRGELGHDLAAADGNGRPVWRLLGLRFTELSRSLTDDAKQELRKVKDFARWCAECRRP